MPSFRFHRARAESGRGADRLAAPVLPLHRAVYSPPGLRSRPRSSSSSLSASRPNALK
jgi:hypothetical protein